ncbi:hypothetical protein ACFL6X_03085, partial [Candidatus Latescibacterota bacterium]
FTYTSVSRILGADIVFNSYYLLPWDTTDPPQGDKKGDEDPKDIQHVGTHEAGHLLGLGHANSDTANTMYYDSGARLALHFRDLEPGDAAGASYIYRRAYGTLSSDADLKEYSWQSGNKHVKMVGDVTVPSGVTLTIKAGTEIEASDTDSTLVQGLAAWPLPVPDRGSIPQGRALHVQRVGPSTGLWIWHAHTDVAGRL